MATPVYRVMCYEFLDTITFGVGALVADIENLKNLGYGEYVNDVGELFFTISQDDPKAALLRSLADRGGHVRVYRNNDNVWSGWLSETDEQPSDTIFYGYSYVAGLFERQTDWEQTWTASTVGTIITDLWARARTTQSRLGWATTGTIESPVTTSGGAIPYTIALYTAYFKRILFCIKELVAASISDTVNRVVFEITPGGVFNLWKNRGSDLTNIRWEWGTPEIIGYRRQRMPVDHRNVVHVVGSNPNDATLRSTFTDANDVNTMGGTREESVYLQWVRDQAELDRVARNRMAMATRTDSFVALTFAPGTLVPFRATGQSYKLTDTVRVVIDNGTTSIDEAKMIVGQQVVLYKNQEVVRPLLSDTLIAFDVWLRLAHGQDENAELVTTHELPELVIPGDMVLLVAFVQDRDHSTLTFPVGWTIRSTETVTYSGITFGYTLADRYVATGASPYAETFTSASASRSHQAEMGFRALGPTVPTETVSDSIVYYPGYSNVPTMTVSLTPGLTDPGDVLIGYVAVTSAAGSSNSGYIWPSGWQPLEVLIPTVPQIGQASTFYKIADGSEGDIAVQSGYSKTQSMALIVVNYGALDIGG